MFSVKSKEEVAKFGFDPLLSSICLLSQRFSRTANILKTTNTNLLPVHMSTSCLGLYILKALFVQRAKQCEQLGDGGEDETVEPGGGNHKESEPGEEADYKGLCIYTNKDKDKNIDKDKD